jgi:hypothetical protein
MGYGPITLPLRHSAGNMTEEGIEPTTSGLSGQRSTTELLDLLAGEPLLLRGHLNPSTTNRNKDLLWYGIRQVDHGDTPTEDGAFLLRRCGLPRITACRDQSNTGRHPPAHRAGPSHHCSTRGPWRGLSSPRRILSLVVPRWGSSVEERRPHKPEGAGSKPAPASCRPLVG